MKTCLENTAEHSRAFSTNKQINVLLSSLVLVVGQDRMFVWLISQIEAAGYASISLLSDVYYSLLLAAADGCLLSPFC
jgi:hypothetical protein